MSNKAIKVCEIVSHTNEVKNSQATEVDKETPTNWYVENDGSEELLNAISILAKIKRVYGCFENGRFIHRSVISGHLGEVISWVSGDDVPKESCLLTKEQVIKMAEDKKPNHDWRQELFNYCSKEHGFDLLESDMNEIKRIIISNPDYIEFLNWQINQQQKSCHHKPLSDAEMLRMANTFAYYPIAHDSYLKGLMKANELIFKLTHK